MPIIRPKGRRTDLCRETRKSLSQLLGVILQAGQKLFFEICDDLRCHTKTKVSKSVICSTVLAVQSAIKKSFILWESGSN